MASLMTSLMTPLTTKPKTLERMGAVLGRATEAGLWLAAAASATSLVRKTQRVIRERKLMAQAAMRDPLTGLANRAMLLHRLETAIRAASETGQQVGVLFCDLDSFRQINKVHGHAAGDLLLAVTALRIESAVRPSDTVARLGGDEFVVVCPGLSPAGDEATAALEAIADRIRQAISEPTTLGGSFAEEVPGEAGGKPVSLGISIGAAIAPGDAMTQGDISARAGLENEADSPGSLSNSCKGTNTGKGIAGWLLRRADLAMSHSKRAKR